jgi:hypothetical protein
MPTKLYRSNPEVAIRVAKVVELREQGGLTFDEIAERLKISRTLANRIYTQAVAVKAATAVLIGEPIRDDTKIETLAPLLPAPVVRVLKALSYAGAEKGTVGVVRRTPDAVLLRFPYIGPSSVATMRQLVGYAPGVEGMTVHDFIVAQRAVSKEAA